jgi:hypothetical protein
MHKDKKKLIVPGAASFLKGFIPSPWDRSTGRSWDSKLRKWTIEQIMR